MTTLGLALRLDPPARRIIGTGKRIVVDSCTVRETEHGAVVEYQLDGVTHTLELVRR